MRQLISEQKPNCIPPTKSFQSYGIGFYHVCTIIIISTLLSAQLGKAGPVVAQQKFRDAIIVMSTVSLQTPRRGQKVRLKQVQVRNVHFVHELLLGHMQ
jgi:hypothetical protein